MGSPLSNLQTLYSATDTGSPPPPPPPQSSPKAHQHFLKHPSMCVQWCAVVSDTFYRPQPTPQMPTWFQTDTQASSPTPAAPINTGVLSGSAHTMLYCLPFLQPKSVFISYSQSLSSFPTAKVCLHFLQPKSVVISYSQSFQRLLYTMLLVVSKVKTKLNLQSTFIQ